VEAYEYLVTGEPLLVYLATDIALSHQLPGGDDGLDARRKVKLSCQAGSTFPLLLASLQQCSSALVLKDSALYGQPVLKRSTWEVPWSAVSIAARHSHHGTQCVCQASVHCSCTLD
jgi:hypothetical protein